MPKTTFPTLPDFHPQGTPASLRSAGHYSMTDRPNADDNLARAHRAEAEANELRADLKAARDALEAVTDHISRAQDAVFVALAKINGRALA
jgi:hypothetical protein